ncbi:MAG: bifunctional oligoribonuclease/PAP phosphatase NrnA [Magnetococcales bacterium]|nr:bifunctional oligoribonuclease/PAP phosphatase NrnA [Magnetococcales bacterium]
MDKEARELKEIRDPREHHSVHELRDLHEPRDPKALELAQLLRGREGERHAVVMQDFPDPDAISCGIAYRLIAAEFGIEAELIYGGRISHQENIALVSLLGIDLDQLPDTPIPAERFQGSVYVDGQGTTSHLTSRLEDAGVPVVAVVDHHEDQARLTPLFRDIRPVGACASIFTHYLMTGLLPLRNAKVEHRRLATGLMHGILSETNAMTRALPFDFAAAAFLQPYWDADMLMEIMNQQRSHKVMEVIRLALANRLTREGVCLSGVGYLRAEERDAIPQAADFLLTEENVHTVIVFGLVSNSDGGESIQGSLRTIKATLSPDAFLKEALGRARDGAWYGGGKMMAGGFEIPLGFLSGFDGEEMAEVKWEAYNSKVRKKIFDKIGVEDK